jgi:hypothetical protein
MLTLCLTFTSLCTGGRCPCSSVSILETSPGEAPQVWGVQAGVAALDFLLLRIVPAGMGALKCHYITLLLADVTWAAGSSRMSSAKQKLEQWLRVM